MENAYQKFLGLLKKFPYGKKFLEHGGKFVGGSYLIWVILILIAILGAARGLKFKQTRTTAGFVLLATVFGLIFYFLFRLFTKYN